MTNTFLKISLGILLCSIFYGCPEKAHDHDYEVLIENVTSDTLLFMYGTDNLSTTLLNNKYICLPNSILIGEKNGFGWIGFDGDKDPVKYFFTIFPHPLDTSLVFRHDTLKARWVYPAYSGPSSEHSFFNYNSWKSWLTDDRNGKIMFTIYPSDLVLNKK